MVYLLGLLCDFSQNSDTKLDAKNDPLSHYWAFLTWCCDAFMVRQDWLFAAIYWCFLAGIAGIGVCLIVVVSRMEGAPLTRIFTVIAFVYAMPA